MAALMNLVFYIRILKAQANTSFVRWNVIFGFNFLRWNSTFARSV